MIMPRRALTVFIAAAALTSLGSRVQTATSCDNLAGLALPQATITSAEVVAAGAFTPPGRGGAGRGGAVYASLPSFCRVAATLKPSTDSDIKVEVWLPASGWNGKL